MQLIIFFQPIEDNSGYCDVERFPVSVCLHLHALFQSVLPFVFLNYNLQAAERS